MNGVIPTPAQAQRAVALGARLRTLRAAFDESRHPRDDGGKFTDGGGGGGGGGKGKPGEGLKDAERRRESIDKEWGRHPNFVRSNYEYWKDRMNRALDEGEPMETHRALGRQIKYQKGHPDYQGYHTKKLTKLLERLHRQTGPDA